MQKKCTPLTDRRAKPERRTAMKFQYNQSDQSSNIFTKFDQNPTHNKQDISRKSGAYRQIDRHIQIKFVGIYSLQTVTTSLLSCIYNYLILIIAFTLLYRIPNKRNQLPSYFDSPDSFQTSRRGSTPVSMFGEDDDISFQPDSPYMRGGQSSFTRPETTSSGYTNIHRAHKSDTINRWM